jgi:protein SCO1
MRRRSFSRACLCLATAPLVWPEAAAAGKWLPAPALPDVALLDHQGQSVRVRDLLRDRPVVVNFFFTGCATVCPPQTALLRQAAVAWRERPALNRALVVSISVDALGDGPQQLRTYGERFQLPLGVQQGWVLLSGAPVPLKQVLQAFDVADGRPDDPPALLWLGDTARGRWTRSSALNPPATTTRLLQELLS